MALDLFYSFNLLKLINMEKFESNFFMKIGNFFFGVGFHYKTGGIRAVYNYYKVDVKFWWFKWKYLHSKKFRNKIVGKDGVGELFGKAVIETVLFNKPIDYKYIYDNLTDEQKVKFKANMEKALQKTIKENNITDEKEIENLRSMFNFNDEK